jgi:hypothetical protein
MLGEDAHMMITIHALITICLHQPLVSKVTQGPSPQFPSTILFTRECLFPKKETLHSGHKLPWSAFEFFFRILLNKVLPALAS